MSTDPPEICKVPLINFVKMLRNIKMKMTEIAKPRFWMKEKTQQQMFASLKNTLFQVCEARESERFDMKKLLESLVARILENMRVPRQEELEKVLDEYEWMDNKEFEMSDVIGMNYKTITHVRNMRGVRWHTGFDRFHVCLAANLFQMAFPEALKKRHWTEELEHFFVQFHTTVWDVCEKMAIVHCEKELADDDCPEEEVCSVPANKVYYQEPYYHILQDNGKYEQFVEDRGSGPVFFDAQFNVISDPGPLYEIDHNKEVTVEEEKKDTLNPSGGTYIKRFEIKYLKQFFTKSDVRRKRAIGVSKAMQRFEQVTGNVGNKYYFYRTWESIRREGTITG